MAIYANLMILINHISFTQNHRKMDFKMDFKTDYISRLFEKTSYKRIENYCITRLWHKRDNPDVKFVLQQYVGRHEDKYALTDIYLPQLGLHIEVNEPAHYDSQERIQADKIRKQQIESQTGHTVLEIDCRLKIELEVDKVLDEINARIKKAKANGTFKPWDPDIEFSPKYWNVEDICTIFGADFKKTRRGFLRKGGIEHPKCSDYLIWWPSVTSRKGWINIMSEDGLSITETHEDASKREAHFKYHQNTPFKRIVFLHHKDILGITSYKFVGVFEYDAQHSSAANGVVWKRTADRVDINPC